jgi:hypothetical protein
MLIIDMRAQCSGFHKNVLPEDVPVRQKHVARQYIYIFKNILTDILVSWM